MRSYASNKLKCLVSLIYVTLGIMQTAPAPEWSVTKSRNCKFGRQLNHGNNDKIYYDNNRSCAHPYISVLQQQIGY